MFVRIGKWLHQGGPGVGLLVARVIMGLFWLGQLTWKPPPGFGCPTGGFCEWVGKEIQHPLLPIYAKFLSNFVAPSVYFWGWVTTIVEITIGLSLLLGLLTRLGGIISMGWSLNLLVGLAAVPNEYPPAYLMLSLLGFLFFTLGGGDRLSLDTSVLRPRLRRDPESRWAELVDALT